MHPPPATPSSTPTFSSTRVLHHTRAGLEMARVAPFGRAAVPHWRGLGGLAGRGGGGVAGLSLEGGSKGQVWTRRWTPAAPAVTWPSRHSQSIPGPRIVHVIAGDRVPLLPEQRKDTFLFPPPHLHRPSIRPAYPTHSPVCSPPLTWKMEHAAGAFRGGGGGWEGVSNQRWTWAFGTLELCAVLWKRASGLCVLCASGGACTW